MGFGQPIQRQNMAEALRRDAFPGGGMVERRNLAETQRQQQSNQDTSGFNSLGKGLKSLMGSGTTGAPPAGATQAYGQGMGVFPASSFPAASTPSMYAAPASATQAGAGTYIGNASSLGLGGSGLGSAAGSGSGLGSAAGSGSGLGAFAGPAAIVTALAGAGHEFDKWGNKEGYNKLDSMGSVNGIGLDNLARSINPMSYTKHPKKGLDNLFNTFTLGLWDDLGGSVENLF